MPSMMEIYDHHSVAYDELVNAEDHAGNLGRTLHGLTTWQNKRVAEAGTGTGRVTGLYVEQCRTATCYDRSPHMLERAAVNLEQYRHKIAFKVADNLDLPPPPEPYDIFVEGWSFGHSISAAENVSRVTEHLVKSAEGMVHLGGMVILIETLGTNVDYANPPQEKLAEFYSLLESCHGYRRTEVATDYQFSSLAEAERIMGFFFGEEMALSISRRGKPLVPEWTGIWSKRIEP